MTMRSITLIRQTSRVSNYLFTHAPRVYAELYHRYKRLSERTNIAVIKDLVKPGSCAVDIGANIGFYTALLADCVGPTGHVYAFEPDERNFARLLASTRHRAQIQAERAAVTDVDGSVELYMSTDLNVDHRTYRDDDSSRVKVAVRGVSLDTFFRNAKAMPQFVKMDIQGAEYRVLLGMKEIVSRSPDLIILTELWPFVHDQFGNGLSTLLDLVDSWGFEMRRIVSSGNHLGDRISSSTPLPERADHDFQFDVLCCRAGRSL